MRTAAPPDLYGLLGVAPTAGVTEIRAAFRARAKQLHPDAVDGDAERFKALGHAHDVLTDPQRRVAYDRARAGARPAAAAPVRAPVVEAPMLRTSARARAACWGGLALVVVGAALAVLVPFLGEAGRGTTIGRDLALWIAAAKLVACGAVLAVVGRRRGRALGGQSPGTR